MTSKQVLLIAVALAIPMSAAAESAKQSTEPQPLTLSKLVEFKYGEVRVDDRGRNELRAVAWAWKQSPGKTLITVDGHAVAADEEASITLGQKRANQVRRYLVRYGVDPKFVVAVGHARYSLEEGGGRFVDLTIETK